jgi:hypothetical protein
MRIAWWLWPPPVADASAQHDDVDAAAKEQQKALAGAEAWSLNTMRWVPLVIPMAALFLLLLTVVIGSRL